MRAAPELAAGWASGDKMLPEWLAGGVKTLRSGLPAALTKAGNLTDSGWGGSAFAAQQGALRRTGW
jgi:hypothetical protein